MEGQKFRKSRRIRNNKKYGPINLFMRGILFQITPLSELVNMSKILKPFFYLISMHTDMDLT
jgi:hypothetical protein